MALAGFTPGHSEPHLAETILSFKHSKAAACPVHKACKCTPLFKLRENGVGSALERSRGGKPFTSAAPAICSAEESVLRIGHYRKLKPFMCRAFVVRISNEYLPFSESCKNTWYLDVIVNWIALQSFLTYVGIGRRNDFLEPCFYLRLATSTCNVVFYSNLFTVLSCGGADRQTLFPRFGQSRTLCLSSLRWTNPRIRAMAHQ